MANHANMDTNAPQRESGVHFRLSGVHFYGVGCILASISRLDYAAVDGVDTKQGTGEPFPVIAAEVVAVFVGEVIAAVEVPDRYQQPLFTGLTISHPGHLQGYPVYLVGGRGKVVAAAGYIVFHQHHFLEDLIDLIEGQKRAVLGGIFAVGVGRTPIEGLDAVVRDGECAAFEGPMGIAGAGRRRQDAVDGLAAGHHIGSYNTFVITMPRRKSSTGQRR